MWVYIKLWWLCNFLDYWSLEWELASSTASLEALEDDTEIICVMQQEHGWSLKM